MLENGAPGRVKAEQRVRVQTSRFPHRLPFCLAPILVVRMLLPTARKRTAFSARWPGLVVIPTRVKADSFRGFQTGASQILWGEQEVRHAARNCTSPGLRRGPALGLSESDP